MAWEIEYTGEFENWWDGLTVEEQESVAIVVQVLSEDGPRLGRPRVDTVRESRHANMKELRIQHQGRPYRVLFAFDPRRVAILLIGGDKTGDSAWYERNVPIADRLYDEHLHSLQRDGG
jgi:hypothetical protein